MPFGWGGFEGRQAYKHLLEGNPSTEIKALLLKIIEPDGFKKRVYFVAMSGFLADSYAIFSTNVISPALAYISWNSDAGGTKGLVINVITLSGSCIGMVLFGWLADVFGRKRLYGVELVIGIVATLGLTQVSAGYDQQSMNPFAWIVWWRFVLGIAIGAEYPLSALIAAEWSATSTRGTMLAAVFLMQPIGQFLAYIVGYAALRGITHNRLPNWTTTDWDDPSKYHQGAATIDAVWRCVIGVGAFPSLLAIALRFTIPETPRYLIDVKEDLPAAAQAIGRVYPEGKNTPAQQNSDKKSEAESGHLPTSKDKGTGVMQNSSIEGNNAVLTQRTAHTVRQAEYAQQSGQTMGGDQANGSIELCENLQEHSRQDAMSNNIGHKGENADVPRTHETISNKDQLKVNEQEPDSVSVRSGDPKPTGETIKNTEFWHDWHIIYKKKQGFRRILAGTSICWFIMDICFYGLGLDTPRTLAKIFGAQPSDATTKVFDWNSGFASQDDNIYDALLGDATRALYTIPISGVCGSVIFLLLVNYIPRVTILRWTFVVLAILFAIAGSSLFAVYETNHHSVTIVFYAFALCILNFGPNTILFMLPAELFPTKYRGTCYGIAAASGKAGAILIQIIVHFAKVSRPASGGFRLAIMLISFTPLMLIGAFVAWIWIPEVQEPSKAEKKKGVKNFRKRMVWVPRSLEEITKDPTEGQYFGLWGHIRHLFGWESRPVDAEAGTKRPTSVGAT